MVLPLKNALKNNPDALCGQIIFQKDGYNMGLRAPVKEGLRRQLKILKDYGYEIVTVSKLLEESPFADIGRDDKDFEIFQNLQESHAIAFADNTLRPDTPMTKGEFAILLTPKKITIHRRINFIKSTSRHTSVVKITHPYSTALKWMVSNGYLTTINGNVTNEDLERCNIFLDFTSKNITRREILKAYYWGIQK